MLRLLVKHPHADAIFLFGMYRGVYNNGGSGGSINDGLDEDFLMQMAEFLGAFMEANLGRVLGVGEICKNNGGGEHAAFFFC